jgi:hypothetical protein
MSASALEPDVHDRVQRQDRRMKTLRATLVLAALCAFAACSDASPTALDQGSTPTSRSTSVATDDRSPIGIWRTYTDCVRSHGFPDAPDPQVDANGVADYPASWTDFKQALVDTQAACGSLLTGLPPGANPLGDSQITAEDIERLHRFVACARENGLPDFKDGYTSNHALVGEGDLKPSDGPKYQHVREVCDHFMDRRIPLN